MAKLLHLTPHASGHLHRLPRLGDNRIIAYVGIAYVIRRGIADVGIAYVGIADSKPVAFGTLFVT